jgi:hypothetical protein
VLRPRLVLYGALAAASAAAFTGITLTRTPFEANVIRLGAIPWLVEGDSVRNQVEIHLVNKRPEPRRFRLSAMAPAGLEAQVRLGQADLELASLAHARVPAIFLARRGQGAGGRPMTIVITDVETGVVRRTTVPFLAPAGM